MVAHKLKNPRSIVITGASSGIGEALAVRYAQEGVCLGLSGRDEARLRSVAQACEEKGARVIWDVVDVRDREAMRAWLLGIDKDVPIDLVIANAGISGGTRGSVGVECAEQVRGIFEVNWYGVLNTIEPVLPEMIARGHGQIALVSSIAGFRGWPGAPAYCASKAAVKIYGEALRGSLKNTGVCVNVICPGFVRSRMTDMNAFPMPFMVEPAFAVEVIVKKLKKNKGRIVFPFVSGFFSWLLMALPDNVAQKLLSYFPAK